VSLGTSCGDSQAPLLCPFNRFQEIARNAFDRQKRARATRFENEGWRVRKAGSQFWANVVITALHEENVHSHRISKITRDLTERKFTKPEENACFPRLRTSGQSRGRTGDLRIFSRNCRAHVTCRKSLKRRRFVHHMRANP